MKVLLDRGADVNAKETLRGTTALMWAAAQGHPAAVQLLIERGADVNARSNPAPIRGEALPANRSIREDRTGRSPLRRRVRRLKRSRGSRRGNRGRPSLRRDAAGATAEPAGPSRSCAATAAVDDDAPVDRQEMTAAD